MGRTILCPAFAELSGKKKSVKLHFMCGEDSLCESITHFGLVYGFDILYVYSFQINTQIHYSDIYDTSSRCYDTMIVRR